MELIDIIKSSILIFTSSIVLSVLIAFLYSKIRNQAKVNIVANNKDLVQHKFKLSSQLLNRENVQLRKLDFEKQNNKNSLIRNHPKYKVVNGNQKADFTQNFKIDYRHNVFTNYEDSN
ncbi:MAG: hypothetical protein IIA49_00270 [Bacteroidetes bacterium]|nr:hypothetical protein [Bacteroidota bacterium]MCH7769448.1 hypothetical protein [Bacteroidota bacterium]